MDQVNGQQYGTFMPANTPQSNTDPSVFLELEKKRIGQGKEILKRELKQNWQKKYAGKLVFPENLSGVNPFALNFLLSSEAFLGYEGISLKFNLVKDQKNLIPQLVWKHFLEKRLAEVEKAIRDGLGPQFSQKDELIAQFREKIGNKLVELNSKSFSKVDLRDKVVSDSTSGNAVIKMPLEKILKDHKNIGEQLITSSPIKLRIFPSTVRPSIKNWIADYHENLGAVKHGMIDRGNYLFHSENGKKLSTLERRRLSEILKSIDEGSELEVDLKSEKVVFENINNQIPQRPSQEPPTSKPPILSAREDDFSSGFGKADLTSKDNPSSRLLFNFGARKGQDNNKENLNKSDVPSSSNSDLRSSSSWNPAEAVKQRMQNEGEKIRFSTPQVLPVEKKFGMQGFQTGRNSSMPPAAIQDENNQGRTRQAASSEKMGNPNGVAAGNAGPKSVFKITPNDYVPNGKDQFSGNQNRSGLGTGGNIVDLRKE